MQARRLLVPFLLTFVVVAPAAAQHPLPAPTPAPAPPPPPPRLVIRVPVPDAASIYRWIRMGDAVVVEA